MDIYFYIPEAYQLFASNTESAREDVSKMIALAEGFSAIDDVGVSFIFHEANIDRLSHPTFNLCRVPRMIEQGIPLASRFVNRYRLNSVKVSGGPVYIVSLGGSSIHMAKAIAQLLGGKNVYFPSLDDPLSMFKPKAQAVNSLVSLLDHVDYTFMFTRRQESLLEELGFQTDGVIVVGPYLARQADYRSESRRRVLWMGLLEECSQPWVVLDLARSNPGIEFVMIGSVRRQGQEKLAFCRYLERRIDNLENVSLVLSSQNSFSLKDQFDKSKLMLSTSLDANGCFNQLLAMSHGIPTIALSKENEGMVESVDLSQYSFENSGSLLSSFAMIYSDDSRLMENSRRAYASASRGPSALLAAEEVTEILKEKRFA